MNGDLFKAIEIYKDIGLLTWDLANYRVAPLSSHDRIGILPIEYTSPSIHYETDINYYLSQRKLKIVEQQRQQHSSSL